MTMAFHSIFILVVGLAAVIAQDTTPSPMSPNPTGLQTTASSDLQYNMTQSVNSTADSVSLSATPADISLSPDTTTDVTIPTTTEKGDKSYTPGPDLNTKTGMTTTMTTKEKETTTVVKNKTVAPASSEPDDTTGIIILVIIILVALAFGIACYFAKKKGRRYSVDFTSRPEEANIPLSAVELDPPVDAAFHNGLQTFESPGAASNQAQEPEATPEAKEEQKAEAEKTPANPDAESAAPEAAPDKPKEDAAEPSSPAAAEPTVEEKTDDEGVDSNKTSVESLKEANVNNSNSSGDLIPQREFESSDLLWDVLSTSV